MGTMTTLLNTILANGSAEYAARIPSATRDNITAVGNAILSYSTTTNEFLSALINKIAMTEVHNKTYSNPLAVLKKGTMPLGKTIEELFTNPATGQKFGTTASTLLTQTKSDTYALFHTRNREDQYPVTVSRAQLAGAFTSEQALSNLLDSIINSLYSGDNLDEFIIMKNTMADAITGSKIVTVEAGDISAAGGAASIAEQMINASKFMTFASPNFNKYKALKGGATKDIITWTPLEDQIIILRADVSTKINLNVLAVAFNMEKAQLQAQILEVDDFGAAQVARVAGTTDGVDVYGIVCDRSWLKCYDSLNEMSEFYNAKELSWNYYWNHWQTISLSHFANAVAFTHVTAK